MPSTLPDLSVLAVYVGSSVGAIAALRLLWRRGCSVLAFLSVLTGVLLVHPSAYVVAGLRSYGAPAMLLSWTALLIWMTGRAIADRDLDTNPQPLRIAIFCFGWASLTSYAVGQARVLTPLEAEGSVRALPILAAYVGVALLALDGLRQRRDIEALLQRVVVFAAIPALGGLLEHMIPTFSYSNILSLPGFVQNFEVDVAARSDFRRVLGSSTHPIEFSVTLAILAPVALHYAAYAPSKRLRRLFGACFSLYAIAIPMAIARSGVLALMVGCFALVATWNGARRLNFACAFMVGTVVLSNAVPGLVGTLRSLFLNIGIDNSSVGRKQDFPLVQAYVADSPWLGRGLGTFQPLEYFYLDNQYLVVLLEGGIPYLLAFALLLVAACWTARQSRLGANASSRSLGQAVFASLLALALSAATFDALSFRQVSIVGFLLVGVAGALRRTSVLEDYESGRTSSNPEPT